MNVFRDARLEKQREEIRAVVSGLEELEVSDDLKLGRNYLFIWADHITKLIEREMLPAVKKNTGEFFVAVEDFKKRL